MRYTCFAFLVLIVACNSESKKHKKSIGVQQSHQVANLLKLNSINKLVAKNHQKLNGVSGDLNSFKRYIAGLNEKDPVSIAYALDYIKTCISPELKEKDSVLLIFNTEFYKVSNTLGDSLETKYATVLNQLDKNPKSAQSKIFTDNLQACGIGVFTTEGNDYPDVLSDYFYNNFKDRVSAGVRVYLNMRKNELAEGFSEDAGLLISFEQLYGRVKQWETFLNDYPNTVYSAEGSNYYTTYLETLMTGTDNSRIFDDDKNVLLPNVKAIYEKAIHDDAGSQTSKIISSYYGFLGRHDFKENDSIPIFLKENKLSTMLAVQTDTR